MAAAREGESERFDVEAYLGSLQPIGWKLGLERMHRLTAALGMPQNRYATIHVVGTNGKSSVARMIAALLEAHGLRAGASVSPHVSRWSQRTLVGGEEIAADKFASAVQRAAEAATAVNRSLRDPNAEEQDAVTQFEVATAASSVALAAAGVEVAVIEAGLGGRLDATNVIASRVTALTSVGLDHTEWLGEIETEIAAEKLAVLRDHTTLVVGRLEPAVGALAREVAAARAARLVQAPDDPGEDIRLLAPGRFQRRNFALACAAAEAFLGELDRERARDVAARLIVPGRLERVRAEPPVFVDAAHNRDGALALAESLPDLAAGREAIGLMAILRDKDAAGMIDALAPAFERVVFTELPEAAIASSGRPRSAWRSALELANLAAASGLAAEAEPRFEEAVRRAHELAAEAPGRMLVMTGSHYVLERARALLPEPRSTGRSR